MFQPNSMPKFVSDRDVAQCVSLTRVFDDDLLPVTNDGIAERPVWLEIVD